MKTSKLFHSNPALPVEGKDVYELAELWQCTPEQAAKRVKQEGWLFTGYNDYGEECFVEKEAK